MSFIIQSSNTSYTDKQEFSSIWIWISCYNDVINDVDLAIKPDIYPQNL